ncbi:MAG: acyltransferase family protein [Microbacteriaceae bacterium]|nr:acyltransferase family protein [Microbacteriaceae bacterium]
MSKPQIDPPSSTPASPYRAFPGLDGLRAIAVVMVLIYHCFAGVLPGGFIGVDVFFCISGFLITSLLVRERDLTGHISLRTFWVKRARRLLPALVLVLLACTAAGSLIGGDVLLRIREQFLSSLLFCANWVFALVGIDYFNENTPELFRNMWSLGVEEQFYVLLPLLLLLILRLHKRGSRAGLFAILGLAGLAATQVLVHFGAAPSRIYFGADTHSMGLFWGAAAAVLLHKSPEAAAAGARVTRSGRRACVLVLSAALAGLVLLAFTMYEGSEFSFRFGYVAATLVGLAAVVAASRETAPLAWLLENRPLRFIGERSYGIYLWHWPLFVLLGAAFKQWNVAVAPVWVGLLALAATLAAACLSYSFVELPIRLIGLRRYFTLIFSSWFKWGKQPDDAPRYGVIRQVCAGIMVALLAFVPGTVVALQNQPQYSSTELAVMRGQEELRRVQEAQKAAAEKKAADVQAGRAQKQEPPKRPQGVPEGAEVSAIGDSVMLASAGELAGALPGIAIDAAVSRSMVAGVKHATQLAAAGGLRKYVVLGLATNGHVTDQDAENIARLAKNHKIVLVNAYGDRSWIPGSNARVAQIAQDNYRNVIVADWQAAIAPHTHLLAQDKIHPSDGGGAIYAKTVSAALLVASQVSAQSGGFAVRCPDSLKMCSF